MTRLRDERGAALVTAMLVMILIGAIGVAGLLAVERFQRSTGDERVREAAFQLAETAMGAQVVPLNATWPRTEARRAPVSCTSTATVAGCPSPSAIAAAFPGTAAESGTWTVEVRDDLGDAQHWYDQALLQTTPCPVTGTTPCTWDSNGNGRLWIRASATAQGRTRTVVSIVRRQEVRVPLPRASVIAGSFRITNNGNKVLVDELGCSAKLGTPVEGCATTQPGAIMVRCTLPATPTTSDPCTGYNPVQVSPPVVSNYSGSIVTTEMAAMLKNAAIASGAYYTTCPSVAEISAKHDVYIEGVNCSYTGNGTINSATDPGRIIIERGTLSLGGTLRFYGLILALNGLTPPADAGPVVTLQGNATVQGAIYIEGKGMLELGSSGENLIFDERALGDATAWSLAGFEHHSFRELTPDR